MTAMSAPNISRIVTFSLKHSTAGGMISTGTVDMIVEAMPVAVCWMENKENDCMIVTFTCRA